MSGFDEFFEDEGDDKPVVPAPVPHDNRVGRSSADDIIDAVEGIKKPPKRSTCPACESTNITFRGSSLSGGTRRLKCRDCGVEIPVATVQSAAVVMGPTRASRGPFYGRPKPKPSKHNPPHRRALEIHEAKKK